jgi:hypothetical protein
MARGAPVIVTGQGCLRLDEISLEGTPDAAAQRAVLNSLRHRLI